VDLTLRCLIETNYAPDGTATQRVWRNPACTGCGVCRRAVPADGERPTWSKAANPHDPPPEWDEV